MDKEKMMEKVTYAFECAELPVRSYSGRGMNGRYCLGVVGETESKVILSLMQALLETHDGEEDGCSQVMEVLEFLGTPRSDSMGYDTIVYWPRVEYQD